MILHGIFFSLSGTYQIRSPSEYLNLSEETESNCLSEILKEDFLFNRKDRLRRSLELKMPAWKRA